MSLFIEGHRRRDQHAVVRRADAVQHGGDVPMVAEIVRAAPIERNRRHCCEAPGAFRSVANHQLHRLDIAPDGHEGGDLRREPLRRPGAAGPVPHEARGDAAAVLPISKFCRLLLCGNARGRPAARLRHQPEIARAAVVVQVVHADRLKDKGLLIELAVAAEVRRDGALEPCLARQREIQGAGVLRLLKAKVAVPVEENRLLHACAPF